MSSAVRDLQKELLNSDCDALRALRQAHAIAVKLNLAEFDKWIQCELNGYPEDDDNFIPEYRRIWGTLYLLDQNRQWSHVGVKEDEDEKKLCSKKFNEPISSLTELYLKNEKVINFNYKGWQNEILSEKCGLLFHTCFRLECSSHYLKDIIEQVKNRLLDWTLKLEEQNILGEDLLFTEEEKQKAKEIPRQINNYFGNVINGNVEKSQVVSGNNNTINFTYEQVSDLLAQVRSALTKENLSPENQEFANELLSDIEAKVSQKESHSRIKSLLVSLKDFLLSTGANVAGTLLANALQPFLC